MKKVLRFIIIIVILLNVVPIAYCDNIKEESVVEVDEKIELLTQRIEELEKENGNLKETLQKYKLGIDDNANLVYLVDQYYENAWVRLMWFLGVGFAVIGIIFPIAIEYYRSSKYNLDKKSISESLKETEKLFSEELETVVKKVYDLEDEVSSKMTDSKLEAKLLKQLSIQKREILDILESTIEELDVSDAVSRSILEEDIKAEKDIEQINSSIVSDESSLKIYINQKLISGISVKEFYRRVIKEVIGEVPDFQKYVPYATGSKRYLINTENKHRNGNPFYAEIKIGDYFIETHKSKRGALKDMVKFLCTIEELDISEV